MKKSPLVATLRELIGEVLRLRDRGGPHANLTQAQGYFDGYARCMMEQGLVTQAELLLLVREERARLTGPATRVLDGTAA